MSKTQDVKQTRNMVAGALAGIVAASAGFAIAATVLTTTNDLVSGSDTLVACDGDGFTVDLTPPAWDATAGDFVVSQVEVSGLDSASCDGKTLDIQLADAANAALADGTATVTSGSDAFTVTLNQSASAADVSTVNTVLY